MTDWLEPIPIQVPEPLRAAVGGHPLVAETLARRGVLTPQAARAFLDPAHYTPSPPEALPDLPAAVERIEVAIHDDQRICVWGDFDVDGQTSTALLVSVLRALGANVTYYIPVRARESHGIGRASLERVLDEGADLLLTCDTGVSEHRTAAYAASRGVDVVITDHHDLPPTLPPAHAIVNPKRLPADHPLAELPGVGVAYKLAEALLARAGRPDETEKLLDLVALGIVADVAAQVDDVRYLLQRGLEVLRNTQRRGLQELMRVAGVAPANVSEEQIGFVLAPRLNALGRLDDANVAVEFFTTDDLTRARTLAHELEGLNARRRLLTRQVQQGAQTQIEQNPSLLQEAALVLSHPNWPASVVGIVAGRLAERYNRPAILIAAPHVLDCASPWSSGTVPNGPVRCPRTEGSTVPDQPARGSARSVPGVDISAAIAAHGEMLHRFGGHPMAAGLSIDLEKIPAFRRALSRTVAQMTAEAPPQPAVTIDAYLPLAELSLDLLADLERLAPFGEGNPPLTLATRNLRLAGVAKIGRHETHRRVTVRDEAGQTHETFWWHGADQRLPEGPFDLAYKARASDYLGRREVQIEWVAARERQPERVAVAAAPALEIKDYRHISNSRDVLRGLLNRGDVQVWTEGADAAHVEGLGRHRLQAGPALAIWTAPPGPQELEAVLDRVSPEQVFLFGQTPGADDIQHFLQRLAGLVKHVLSSKSGQVSLEALAAATAQRKATVLLGLDWLAARGQVQIVERTNDTVTLVHGKDAPPKPSRQIKTRLRVLLEETAAYRKFFQRAAVEKLIVEQ